MSKGVRVIGPDRAQLRWEMVDLDSQLPDDHRARVVWAFVQGMDLAELYDRIKARDEVAGRPATDPQVVLAVWLYATMEGIGSARAIDRLCQQHAAYRWLCGGGGRSITICCRSFGASARRHYHGDDPGRHRQTDGALSRHDDLQSTAAGAH